MAVFEVQGPDGSIFEVDAPDQNAAIAGYKRFQSGKFGPPVVAPEPTPPQAAPPPTGTSNSALSAMSPDDIYGVALQNTSRPELAAAISSGGRAADDRVRQLAKGAPLIGPYMDEISAGLNTGFGVLGDYDKALAYERGRDKSFEQSNPVESTALQTTGGLAGGLSALRAGAPLLGAGKSLASRVGTGAAVGAGVGAVEGFGRGEGGLEPRVQSAKEGAAIGGALGLAAPVVAAGVGKAVTSLGPKPPVPSGEEIETAARAAYKRADDAGVVVRPQALQRLAADVVTDLRESGYDPGLQSAAAVPLRKLGEMVQGNATLREVDTLRKMALAVKTNADPSTRLMGGKIVEKIDDFLGDLHPRDALMGDIKDGVQTLQEARQGWRIARKSETIDNALERAANNAASSGSGGNIDNAIRQQFRSVLNDERKRLGFSDDEIAAMTKIVRGDTIQNALRLAGKLSPQGNGLALLLNAGAALQTGGASLPAAALGTAAKALSDKATGRNVGQLSRVVRGGGTAAAVSPDPRLGNRIGSATGLSLFSVPDDDLVPYPLSRRR